MNLPKVFLVVGVIFLSCVNTAGADEISDAIDELENAVNNIMANDFGDLNADVQAEASSLASKIGELETLRSDVASNPTPDGDTLETWMDSLCELIEFIEAARAEFTGWKSDPVLSADLQAMLEDAVEKAVALIEQLEQWKMALLHRILVNDLSFDTDEITAELDALEGAAPDNAELLAEVGKLRDVLQPLKDLITSIKDFFFPEADKREMQYKKLCQEIDVLEQGREAWYNFLHALGDGLIKDIVKKILEHIDDKLAEARKAALALLIEDAAMKIQPLFDFYKDITIQVIVNKIGGDKNSPLRKKLDGILEILEVVQDAGNKMRDIDLQLVCDIIKAINKAMFKIDKIQDPTDNPPEHPFLVEWRQMLKDFKKKLEKCKQIWVDKDIGNKLADLSFELKAIILLMQNPGPFIKDVLEKIQAVLDLIPSSGSIDWKTLCDIIDAIKALINEMENVPAMNNQQSPFHSKLTRLMDLLQLLEKCKKQVYGDPHFLVDVAGSKNPVCFDINGLGGDVLQLLHDESIGLTVNGQLVETKKSTPEHHRTVFGDVAVMKNGCLIHINATTVVLNGVELPWKDMKHRIVCGMRLSGAEGSRLTIHVADGISILVMYNLVHHHLGVILAENWGLSPQAHGLFGQLQTKVVNITGDIKKKGSSGLMTVLSSPGHPQVEVRPERRNEKTSDKGVSCWFIEQEDNPLLDGTKEEYFVPGQDLLYDKLVPALRRFVKKQDHQFSSKNDKMSHVSF